VSRGVWLLRRRGWVEKGRRDFFVVGKYEVKSCYIREFRGERHNQGWRGGLTSTTRDGIFWGG